MGTESMFSKHSISGAGPDYRYIKVRGYDGLYILRFDETRAEWHLTMFKRAGAEGI